MNELAEDTDGLFLGEVSSGEKPWIAEIGLKGSKMTFKIDTGTDVTAIPEQVYISVMQGDKEIKRSPETTVWSWWCKTECPGVSHRNTHLQREEHHRENLHCQRPGHRTSIEQASFSETQTGSQSGHDRPRDSKDDLP